MRKKFQSKWCPICPPFAAITNDNRLRNCLIARLIVSWLISSRHAVRTSLKCSIFRILSLQSPDKLLKHSSDRIVYGIQIRTVRWPIFWFIKVWNMSSEKSNCFSWTMSRCSILQTSVSATNRSARLARTWFTDDKIFQTPTNSQNGRVYANVAVKRDIPSERLLKGRKLFSLSIMHSVAVSQLGKSSLVFVLLWHCPTSRITARH